MPPPPPPILYLFSLLCHHHRWILVTQLHNSKRLLPMSMVKINWRNDVMKIKVAFFSFTFVFSFNVFKLSMFTAVVRSRNKNRSLNHHRSDTSSFKQWKRRIKVLTPTFTFDNISLSGKISHVAKKGPGWAQCLIYTKILWVFVPGPCGSVAHQLNLIILVLINL